MCIYIYIYIKGWPPPSFHSTPRKAVNHFNKFLFEHLLFFFFFSFWLGKDLKGIQSWLASLVKGKCGSWRKVAKGYYILGLYTHLSYNKCDPQVYRSHVLWEVSAYTRNTIYLLRKVTGFQNDSFNGLGFVPSISRHMITCYTSLVHQT